MVPSRALPLVTSKKFSALRGLWALGLALTATAFGGDLSRKELTELFRPDHIAQVAFAPDGAHLAYVVRSSNAQWIVIRSVDRPEEKTTVYFGVDEQRGRRFRVTFLEWADAARLVYAVAVPPERERVNEEIHVVGMDGKGDRKLTDSEAMETVYWGKGDLDAHSVRRRLRVIGFPTDKAGTLVIEALFDLARETEAYQIDLATGKVTRTDRCDSMDRSLFDQQGGLRVVQTSEFPSGLNGGMRGMDPAPRRQRFRVRLAPRGPWEDLDRVTKPSQLAFNHVIDEWYHPRSFPLGFDADPHVLYYASNVGRDTVGLFRLDLTTGTRAAVPVETAGQDLFDPADALDSRKLVFDRQGHLSGVRLPAPNGGTHWLDARLGEWQRLLATRFPDRETRIVGWDDAKTRVLVYVVGPGTPGRYFVVQSGPPERYLEVLRQFLAWPSERLAPVDAFSFLAPYGVRLSAKMTFALQPRQTPAPLVVRFREIPGRAGAEVGFDPGAQALAALGFNVLDVDHRGAAGYGIAFRDAAKTAPDRVALEDVRAAVAWAREHYRFNSRRVAVLGDGIGGYLALRAAELYPAEFQCAVTINGPTDLDRWLRENNPSPMPGAPRFTLKEVRLRSSFFDVNSAALASLSVVTGVKTLAAPVLMIRDPGEAWYDLGHVKALTTALARQHRELETAEQRGARRSDDPDGQARTYLRIAQFLNANLYSYRVDVGEEKPLP